MEQQDRNLRNYNANFLRFLLLSGVSAEAENNQDMEEVAEATQLNNVLNQFWPAVVASIKDEQLMQMWLEVLDKCE